MSSTNAGSMDQRPTENCEISKKKQEKTSSQLVGTGNSGHEPNVIEDEDDVIEFRYGTLCICEKHRIMVMFF